MEFETEMCVAYHTVKKKLALFLHNIDIIRLLFLWMHLHAINLQVSSIFLQEVETNSIFDWHCVFTQNIIYVC